jgi:hypothetical protein
MSLDRIGAWGGSFLIADTSTYTLNGKGENLKVKSFICQEDTVINTLTGVDEFGAAVNFETIFGLTASPSPTLKANSLWCVPLNWAITSIDLTSGSIIVYE